MTPDPCQPGGAALRVHQGYRYTIVTMINGAQPHTEDIIRKFLRERFRGMTTLTERFDLDRTAQRFTLGAGTPGMHTLIVPKETLDDLDFVSLLNDNLVDTLRMAGAMPLILTINGPRY